MNKKTTIQELIEFFELDEQLKKSMPHLIAIVKEVYLEKEKQQILDAYNAGYREAESNSNMPLRTKDISKYSEAINYYKNKQY